MWRCRYCGKSADVAGCPHCGDTSVEYVSDVPADVPELMDITCVGDAAQCRIYDSRGRMLSHVAGDVSAFCNVVTR